MHVSTYRSGFTKLSGKVTLDEENPSASSIEATIEAKSLATDPKTRFYEVMQGEEFFDSEKHPQLVFKSAAVSRSDATHWRADGTLSIRGVERPFGLDVEFIGEANQPFNKKRMRAFRATGSLDRRDYGMKWQATLDTGAAYLGEKIHITLIIELLKAE